MTYFDIYLLSCHSDLQQHKPPSFFRSGARILGRRSLVACRETKQTKSCRQVLSSTFFFRYFFKYTWAKLNAHLCSERGRDAARIDRRWNYGKLTERTQVDFPLSVQIFDQMRHHAAPGSCSQIASARDSLNFLWHPYGGSKRIWPVRCLGNCFPAIDLPSSKGRLSYTKYERKYLWDTMREIGLISAPWLTSIIYCISRTEKLFLKRDVLLLYGNSSMPSL